MKIKITLLAIMICISYFSACIFIPKTPAVIHASTVGQKFEIRYVLTDLYDSTLDGVPFAIADYPYNEHDTIKVINFVEYGYSYYDNLSYDYGLYMYIYNPQKLNINIDSLSNKIQMASLYFANNEPADYTKYDIKLCSVSTGSYDKLFYKFKVDFTQEQLTAVLQRIKTNRRYDISSIELFLDGATNADDYACDYTVTVGGYAKGFGQDPTADSTLSVHIDKLETLSLDVNHTYFLNPAQGDYYDKLNTVYFSVPNYIWEYYGSLQRIKAEWYEYKTKNILVTKNKETYDRIKKYLGEHIPNFLNNDIGKTIAYNYKEHGIDMPTADWAYNLGYGLLLSPGAGQVKEITDILYFLFYVNNIKDEIPGDKLSQAIFDYNKSYEYGTLPIKYGTVSADLFQNDIDAGRKIQNEFGYIKKGYSYYDFDYGQTIGDLSGYDNSDHSFLEQIKQNGLWNTLFDSDKNNTPSYPNIMPIYELSNKDFNGTDETISQRILVREDDINTLQSYYTSEKAKDRTVILFRFAVSKHFSGAVTILQDPLEHIWTTKLEGQAYINTQTVFLDFDIIQLTFLKDDIYRVIPVVSNPIDIVNDIVPPYSMPDKDDWWKDLIKKILFWVAVVVIFLLIFPFLPTIIVTVFNIILLPFRLIIRLFKGGG